MTLLNMHSIFLYALQFICKCTVHMPFSISYNCLFYHKYGLLTVSRTYLDCTGTDHIELLLFQACKFICHVISSSFPKLVLFAVKCHCNSQVFIYEKKCMCKMTNAAFLFIL